MDLQYDRKLEINEWLINARWFYMVAVFLIGILGNSLLGIFDYKSSFFSIAFLLLIFIFVNAYLYSLITRIKKSRSVNKLKLLSVFQIAIEMAVFTIILHISGDKVMSSIFFFLPIISASIIFGVRGAVITAVLSGALVNISVTVDYFSYIAGNVLNKKVFSLLEFEQFKFLTVEFIKTIVTTNFYLVLAIFSGYSSKLLFKREQGLINQADNLFKVKEYRENELRQLDKTTKLLVKRDLQLTAINKVLDKKLQELENSEKSMLKAFADLKEERKSAERERSKIKAIIANFTDPIILINDHGRLSLINPAARDIFSLTEADLGKMIKSDNNYSLANFKDIIEKEYSFKTSQELKSGDPNEEEVVINYNDQDLTFKVITAKVADQENEFYGTMKMFYNLTREKMIDKMKSDFISIAAHQLRTPLSAIKWVIKMVLDGDAGKLNQEQEKYLFKGYQSNERIINLVNDMLNVSRIEEGRFGYSFSDSDFLEVLNQVVDSLENQIKEKQINLTMKLPKRSPIVYMDKQKMTLVLQNLLENAVKYTPEHGKIEINVAPGDQLLQFKIKDNGVGIPAKDQAKLFSKFFRADNVIRMQSEGSGLGLFIVKNIIQRHGGDISFSSREGKGAEFIFTLPIK